MELTPLQQAAAAVPDPPADTCVVAGPGSGKTTVLIERFQRLIASGVPPLRILAITFTEKATNNMKRRLMAAFAGQLALHREMERAYVSTVDGFCARLLRENAIAAGMDPEFRVLGEHEAVPFEQRAAADALDEYFRLHRGEMRDLLGKLASPDISGVMLDVYDALRAAGETVAGLRVAADGSRAAALVERILDASIRLRETPRFSLKPEARTQLENVLEWSRGLESLAGRAACQEHLERLAVFDVNLGRLRNDWARQLKNELVPALETAVADELYVAERQTFLGALRHFDQLFRSRKRSAGVVDFADLEEAAVSLLRDNPEVRERVRSQFDHVLMDEFQDTNGLQSALLELLRPPHRFYAVGDINQSIYGFRHANPEVFRQYRSAVGRSGVRELNENWRSRADILSAVEAVCLGAPGIDPHRLVPARTMAARSEPAVEAIAALGPTTDEAMELEAAWVAARIVELRDRLLLEKGPARYRDMALLFRSSTPMGVFASALEAAGVPFVITGGKGFYEAREVADLTHLLRVLANARDEVSLAAVLRSPLVGIGDETLLRLRTLGRLADAVLMPLVGFEPRDAERLQEFLSRLARWRREAEVLPPDRVLMAAMDEAGYEASLSARALANVEKFLVSVRDAARRTSLDEMVDELAVIRESDPREADAQSEETGDVVRLQTIHSAKGLEFPIVFLPALHSGDRNDTPPIRFESGTGLGFRWRNPVDGHTLPDSLYQEIGDRDKVRRANEADRLLYVAMTRAEEHLVLSWSLAGKKPADWAARVESGLGVELRTPSAPQTVLVRAGTGAAFAARVMASGQRPPSVEGKEAVAEAPAAGILLVDRAHAGEQYDSAASVTSVSLFGECPRRYFLARYVGAAGDWTIDAEATPNPDPGDLDASDFGREVHAVLAGDLPRDRAHPEALVLASRFESSELGRRAAETLFVEREFDLLMAIDDVVLSGQIDLWFEHDGDLLVVDYKTDTVEAEVSEARADDYAMQLRLYALALQRLTGRPVTGAYVYLLRPDRAIPIDISPARLRAAREEVHRFREAQDRMEFPLREGTRCLRCPYHRGLCPSRFGLDQM